ncbi:hypothetical protein [Bradyrhizobium sp. USDA 4520]
MTKALGVISEPERVLEAVSTGALSPAEAFVAIRSFVNSQPEDAEFLEDAYEAIMELVWSLIAGRERGPLLDRWGDFVLKVRQLFRTRKSPLAERLTSFADLLEQSSRFAEVHSAETMKERKHDASILELLLRRSGPTERSHLIETLRIGESNLSRVLLNLISSGLITKSTKGREVLLELTSEGRVAAAKLPKKVEDVPSITSIFDNHDAVHTLKTLWPKTGCAIAITDEAAGLVDCDTTFATLLKGRDARQLRGQSLAILRKNFGDQITGLDEVAPDEIIVSDGKVYRVAEYEEGGRSVWLGFDVSAYKRRIDEGRRREKLLLKEVETLKSKQPLPDRPSRHGLPVAIVPDDATRFAPLWTALSTLRHDILTPVNSILSVSLLMKDKEKCLRRPGFYEESVSGIIMQAQHIRALVRDLFNAGELLESMPVHALDSFSPAAVVDDLLETVKYTSRHSNLSFATPRVAQSMVKTDERVFRGVFLQAVSGFLELLPAGGNVSIEGSIEDRALKVRISTAASAWNLSALRNEPSGLMMCGWAVEHAGGKFDYNRSTQDGIFAEFQLPVQLRPHARSRVR